MAPDLPMKRQRAPCRAKAPRIPSACRYSNAPISQPVRQVLLAPAAVVGGRVEGAKRLVVQDRLVGVEEGVAKADPKRSACSGLEFGQPLRRNVVGSWCGSLRPRRLGIHD